MPEKFPTPTTKYEIKAVKAMPNSVPKTATEVLIDKPCAV